MKKQIFSSMAVMLLSGCVYYVPYEVAATEPWVDEPVAYEEPAVTYESYVVSPYYPWASLDYFYFGNSYYRPYSGFSFSFGFYAGGGWYPPYYSPYYYSAWYQPFYGFPYPFYYPYPYAYYGGGYNHWDHHHGDDHGDYHGGGHDGGYGGHGGGHPGNGPGDSYYGKGVDRSIRKGGYPSLDRHVDVQREPGQFNRNGSAKPDAAPPRTGPGGLTRPAPAQGSNGKQYSVRQVAPAHAAPVQQSAPQPSFNQQNVPQPVRAAPTGDYSGRPEGDYDRGARAGGDNEGGFHHRDHDDR